MKKALTKVSLLVAGVMGLANSAFAVGITIGTDGTVAGNIDMAPMFSAAAICISAVASFIVMKWVYGFFRRA